MIRKNFSLVFFIVVILLSLTCFAAWNYIEKNYKELPYYGNVKMAGNFSGVGKNNLTPLSAFSFINQDGKIINQDFILNKIWVADFFFTRCGSICPKMSNHLQQVQNEFSVNTNVKIISFTCDPEHDNPKQLSEYAKIYQADLAQWQFATGDKKQLYSFARKRLNITATDGDGGVNDFIHSQSLVLIDRKGFIRGYYDGTNNESINQLITDIKKLL